jgi:hypothetical protein
MVGAPQVGVGVDQVIGAEPGSPLDLLSTVASSLDLLSTVASSPLDPSSGAGPSPLDLSSDAGPSHQFGVCGVLGAKRQIGESSCCASGFLLQATDRERGRLEAMPVPHLVNQAPALCRGCDARRELQLQLSSVLIAFTRFTPDRHRRYQVYENE